MEPKLSATQAREARYAKAKAAKDKFQALKSGGRSSSPDKPFLSSGQLEKEPLPTDAQREAFQPELDDAKSSNHRYKPGTQIPHEFRHLIGKHPAKQHEILEKAYEYRKEAQQGKDEAEKNENEPAFEIAQPVVNASSSTEHPRDANHRENSAKMAAAPLDADVTPFSSERTILQQSMERLTLFPTVPLPPPPTERPIQLPSLDTAEIPAFTGRSPSSTGSSDPSEWAPSEPETLTQPQRAGPSSEAVLNMLSLRSSDPLAIGLRRSERTARIEPEFGGLENHEAKLLRDNQVGFDGAEDEDDDGVPFEDDEEHESTPVPVAVPEVRSGRWLILRSGSSRSVTPAPVPAIPAPADVPAERDITFSTRPSRAAARIASAAITASQQSGRGRGRGRGRARARGSYRGRATAPPPTASAPPPPSPPRSPGRGTGHNETWGFTTGPQGPWIEPPVIKDPMFARPSSRRWLKKEVKEAIAQLKEDDPNYDPHARPVVRKQTNMYEMRVKGAMGQWGTSNVRGAVDWEEVQKMRLRVAVEDAMRQMVEEEREEKLKEQREAGMRDGERDNGEGSSRSNDQAKEPADVSAGERPGLARADSDDEDDDTATIVPEHYRSGGDDAANSLPGIDPDTLPRSFNDDFAQRRAAERDARRDRLQRELDDVERRVHALAEEAARRREANLARLYDENPHLVRPETLPSASFATAPRARPAPPATPPSSSSSSRPDYTHPPPNAPAHLRQIAASVLASMGTIAPRDPHRVTGDGVPLRMHDFEYGNLVASGRIGGAADTRAARPARGPYVAQGGGEARVQGLDAYNARLRDLMQRHLGLELEPPPPAAEAFPPLTGTWPRLPAELIEPVSLSEVVRAQGGANGNGSGPFGEGSSGSGSGQRRQPRRQD